MKSLIHAFTSRRMATVLLLGFSSGIPLALTGGTLQAWMSNEKVDITTIGLFSLVGLPYTFKFLWSPIMDRFFPPVLGDKLGRRRGWIFLSQLFLVLGIVAMGFTNPASNTLALAGLAFLVAFFSATQDIVVDAYRTEVAESNELGIGAGLYIMGYRIAMLVSGALALILADHVSWKIVYQIMALTMLVGIFAALWGPEPSKKVTAPKTLAEAVWLPFKEFFSRRGWLEIMIFIVIYKMDVVMANALTTPFMLELGFSKTDIGAVNKGFGLLATIIGTLVGGAYMTKFGLKKSLWFFGIFQGVSGLSFIGLAHFGHSYPMLIGAIAAENLCSGMGTAAYAAFLMSLCDRRFTATQYALLTSLMALTRTIAGAPTGWIAKSLGWEMYFVVSMLLMIPGLLMLLRFDHWSLPNYKEETVK